MEYRLAKQEDLRAVASIRGTDTTSEAYWFNRIGNYYSGTHHPQQALPARVIFVAEDHGQVVGFIAGHLTRRFDCEGELQWIDTLADYRRKGIAATLLKLLANWFTEHEANRICVNCSPDNIVALNFYQKNGAIPLNDHWLIWENISTKGKA